MTENRDQGIGLNGCVKKNRCRVHLMLLRGCRWVLCMEYKTGVGEGRESRNSRAK